MNVYDIVKNYLKENGYDGLAGDGCGCGIDDLGPCETVDQDNCLAAHAYQCVVNSKPQCGTCEIRRACSGVPLRANAVVYVAGKKEEK